MDSLRGTREAGKDSLDSLRGTREAGKDQLDSLRGTRDAGKTACEAPGRQERSLLPSTDVPLKCHSEHRIPFNKEPPGRQERSIWTA